MRYVYFLELRNGMFTSARPTTFAVAYAPGQDPIWTMRYGKLSEP